MNLFKQLTSSEELIYRQWAQRNYEPLTEISGIWHPVVQDECVKMNKQRTDYAEVENQHALSEGYPAPCK